MKSFRSLVFLTFCCLAFADYRRDALEQHNNLRAIHDALPMRLSGSLNEAADQYAQHLFNTLRCRGRLVHSNTPGEGENLASGWTTADIPEARSVQDAVKSWYDEVCQYNFNLHRYQSGLGHFSQIVWKASRELGIGKYTGRSQGRTCTYIVARYKDAGNVNSSRYFQRNVSKGSFRESYCNTIADKSVGEDKYTDAPEGSTEP